MENTNDRTGEDLVEEKTPEFKKSDFNIFMEEMGNGFHKFYIKSGETFKKFRKAIRNALKYFRFRFLNIFRDRSIEEEQYEMARKLYQQNKRLKRKLQGIEKSIDKTQDIASQIKDDTEKIVLKLDDVVIILENQMAKIDDVEAYMRKKLGTDWTQISNYWKEFKDGKITRGEFAKEALKKLGKNFLSIFINVVV